MKYLLMMLALIPFVLFAQPKKSFNGSITYLLKNNNEPDTFKFYFGKNKCTIEKSKYSKYHFYDRHVTIFGRKNITTYTINDERKTVDISKIDTFKSFCPQILNNPKESLLGHLVTFYSINSTKTEYSGVNFETKYKVLISDDLYFKLPNSTPTGDLYCANGTGRIALGLDKTMYLDQAIEGLENGSKTTIRAIEIKEYDVPDEVFEAPKGYRVIEKGNLGLD